MAEESLDQPHATSHSSSDNVHNVDTDSFDAEYLATCVLFAQSHGIFPKSQGCQQDTSLGHASPGVLPQPLHQNPDPNLFHGIYQNQFVAINAERNDDSNSDAPFPQCDDSMNLDEDPVEDATLPANNVYSGPSLAQPVRGVGAANRKTKQKLCLAITYNYDPFWAQTAGVDAESILRPRSKMKFEKLFIDGVVQQGDCLVVPVTCNGDSVERPDSANFTFTGFSKVYDQNHKVKDYPDLTLTLRHDPSFHHTVLTCKGTNTLNATLLSLGIKPSIPPSDSIAIHLNVWRGDRCLGDFDYVRQAYQTWINNMDAANSNAPQAWRRTQKRTTRVAAAAVEMEKGVKEEEEEEEEQL